VGPGSRKNPTAAPMTHRAFGDHRARRIVLIGDGAWTDVVAAATTAIGYQARSGACHHPDLDGGNDLYRRWPICPMRRTPLSSRSQLTRCRPLTGAMDGAGAGGLVLF